MFKKETPCDPNKHICRADLMGLVCVSLKVLCVTHTITPASFSLSKHIHLHGASRACGLWERHIRKLLVLKEYESAHIKEDFLELSKWPQGTHQ